MTQSIHDVAVQFNYICQLWQSFKLPFFIVELQKLTLTLNIVRVQWRKNVYKVGLQFKNEYMQIGVLQNVNFIEENLNEAKIQDKSSTKLIQIFLFPNLPLLPLGTNLPSTDSYYSTCICPGKFLRTVIN